MTFGCRPAILLGGKPAYVVPGNMVPSFWEVYAEDVEGHRFALVDVVSKVDAENVLRLLEALAHNSAALNRLLGVRG